MGKTPRNILLQSGLCGYLMFRLNIHPDSVKEMFFYVCLL
jgi:hypothetical protein